MKKLAVVQRASAFLDKQRSIALAVESIQSAADNGAELVVFTEAFIPGYPVWLWRLRPGKDWEQQTTLSTFNEQCCRFKLRGLSSDL